MGVINMRCAVVVLCVIGICRGDLLDLFGAQETKVAAKELAVVEDWGSDIADYDTFDETAKLVPAEASDYRNFNTTCGAACSYSILGMAGVASFLANRYLNQRPVARLSARKGPDFGELQAELKELKELKEKVADVSEKMANALKVAEEEKKKKMAYALKVSQEKKKRKKMFEKYSGRKRGGSSKGLLDQIGKGIGKGLQYAVKYAKELERAKQKRK